MIRKIAVLLAVLLAFGFAALGEEAARPVAILYTHDVHCAIDENIGYAGVAAYASAYEKQGYDVILVDCGDAVQGGPIGTLSEGEYIIDIMNEMGYDVAAIGNHEFDYGMDQFLALRDQAAFPYVSSNFMDANGETVVDPYVILQAGGYEIAFLGATTPKTGSVYFTDDAGNLIYNMSQGDDGKKLYAALQSAADAARADGADFVVLLSHLGIEAECVPYTSGDVIVNTTGIDVVLDAHSHSVIEGEWVKNAAGEEVLLTSTGTKLANLGTLIIAGDGSFASQLHSESIFQDEAMQEYVRSIQAQYSQILDQVVAHSQVDLVTDDPATGERLVRSGETNLANLCADAYRAVTGSDIALVNGGGVRAGIPAGEITYGQILNVHPFGNTLCMVEATGAEILDALEMGVYGLPGEDGSLQHPSGLSYEVDTGIPSGVVLDENGMFVGVEGERRVKNVLVGGQPIDPEKTYTLASHNYMIKLGGSGMNMFMDNELLLDETMLDNQLLIHYIVDVLGGEVGEEYADPYGEGRLIVE